MSYTIKFILISIFISLTVGSFLAMCIVNLINESGKPIAKCIIGIVLAAMIGFSIGGLIIMQRKGDDKAWNNGYCTECNKPYKFVNKVCHKNNSDEYYYTCDNCGHTIMIHGLRER